MTKTLSYIPFLKGADINLQDIMLKVLVYADIDCFLDEKSRIMVHPDQYDKAKSLII